LLVDGVVAWRFESHGWPAICLELRQAKAATGAMSNKTDRISENRPARAIAQIM
jgi:hypothetical protein